MVRPKIRKSLTEIKIAINKPALWICLAAILRILLAYWQYSGDIRNHLAWAEGLLAHRTEFFTLEFPGFNRPNYPPVALYLFSISLWLYKISYQTVLSLNNTIQIFPSSLIPIFESENMRALFMKLPTMIADLVIGLTIYSLVVKKSLKLTFMNLFLFNPAVIYVSTVWGQIESIVIMFLFLSWRFASEKKVLLAHTMLMLAILSKQTALWLLPFHLVWLWQVQGIPKLLMGIMLQIVVFIVSFWILGLGLSSSFGWYTDTLSGSSTYVSDSAWNIWSYIYPQGTSDTQTIGVVSVRGLSITVVILGYFYVIWQQITRKISLAKAMLLGSFIAFFFQTRVHERHLYPAVPLLLLQDASGKILYLAYAVVTVFFYLNLYHSLRLPFI